MFSRVISRVAAASAALSLAAMMSSAFALPTEDGLYATFRTSHGTYTIDLAFEEVPMTVANFVGLAEGSRPWIDFKTGKASTEPFYDGLKIPRAEPGFVIQMGSPTNSTSGGPGYQFGDEFHPNQRHSAAGAVSMANSGPFTNGSQIFITLAATTSLDRKHAVFGTVVEGLAAVQAIGLLPGGTVTINSVKITRIGAAAEAFDVHDWGLPAVREPALELDGSGAPGAYLLKFDRRPFTQYYTFNSSTLDTWQASWFSLLDSAPPADQDVTSLTTGQDQHFFNVAEIEYSTVPASPNGQTITLNLLSSDPQQTLAITFTADERGSIDYTNPLGTFLLTTPGSADSTGLIGAYIWTQELGRGVAIVDLENLGIFYFNHQFRPDGTGSFTGYPDGGNSSGPFPFYGNFTATATP